ncbi:hypothetical protein EDB89DRAFT_1957130 [Lactarius sanguifluus]|nr:hypothetical protein EDB89DRAFT_1957130 [Lactarius sanguifluus]
MTGLSARLTISILSPACMSIQARASWSDSDSTRIRASGCPRRCSFACSFAPARNALRCDFAEPATESRANISRVSVMRSCCAAGTNAGDTRSPSGCWSNLP